MTHLQHRNSGFSFIEIMLALFLMGTLLTAVMNLSQTTIIALFDYSERLQRIFILQETVFDISYAKLQRKPIKKNERKHEGPPTKISYRVVPISEKSSLKAYKDDLDLYNVKAEWTSLFAPREETMIGLFLKDEKK